MVDESVNIGSTRGGLQVDFFKNSFELTLVPS